MNVGIIGLGNPLRGDDAIGIVLLHRLQAKKKKTWRAFSFIDAGTGGLTILHDLSDFTHVLFIDAIDFQSTPGQHHVFSANDILTSPVLPTTVSTHEPDLFTVIRLSSQMGTLPKVVKIFGVQPATLDYRTGLSPQVTGQVEELTKTLVSLLDQLPRLH